MIKGIIFDFYGVVSVRAHEVFLEEVVEKFAHVGEDFYAFRHQHDLGQVSVDRYWQRIAEVTGVPAEECIERMRSQRVINTPLLGIIRTQLKPGYRIGMLSNAAYDLRRFIDPPDALDGLFDDMIISADVGMVKPDPRLFRLACERLGTAPGETIMIDDIAENCDGARVAGLAAIHYRNLKQCRIELAQLLEQ